MIKNLSKQKIALAASMALALISAQAQTADGTVVITGQVNANTCKVNISDTSGVAPTNNGVRSMSLGTISPTSASGVAAGGLLGAKQTINFTLTNSTGSGACTFLSGTYWNMALDLQSNQVSIAGGKSYLTNLQGTGAATNIGVALFDSTGAQITTLLTGQGYLGTKLVTGSSTKAAGDTISMGAQFMATSATAPTAGLFQTTVPLLIVYQ